MKQSSVSVLFSLALLLVVAYPSPAQDSVARTATTRETRQVKVITSGGFTAAFNILGPMFAQATGIEVITEYGSSMGGGPESIPVRLERGETADLLIFNGRAFDDLAATGHLRTATRVDLARSVTGMAVRAGAPKPDISTVEAFITRRDRAGRECRGTWGGRDRLSGDERDPADRGRGVGRSVTR